MKMNPLIAFFAATLRMAINPTTMPTQFRYGTSPRRRKLKSGNLPKCYPGAKLARMAMQNRIGVKVPSGLAVVDGRVTIRELRNE